MKAILTKYLGPTDRRGSRIKATDGDLNAITISYDDASSNPHRDAAIALCAKMGWHGLMAQGGTPEGDVFVFCGYDADCFTV